jgi:hypothetical protein
MSFTGFPTELPAITRAVSNLLSEPLGPPPDMRSLGQKTFDVFQQNKLNLDLVRKRDWRHVPYAIWLQKDIGLQKQSEVIDRYFEVELAEALNSTRRPLKWGRPLVFVYIEQFNFEDPPKVRKIRFLYFGIWSIFFLTFISLGLYYTITFRREVDVIFMSIYAGTSISSQIMKYLLP